MTNLSTFLSSTDNVALTDNISSRNAFLSISESNPRSEVIRWNSKSLPHALSTVVFTSAAISNSSGTCE